MTALRPLSIALSAAMLIALLPARADAQCRRVCEVGENRDSQGCCLATKKTRKKVARGPRVDKITKEAFARLPDNMMLVGAINVAAIRKTELYKDMISNFESEEDFKKVFNEMQAEWGMDYRKDIDHVWLAVPDALSNTDPVIVLIKGKWKNRTIIKWMKKEWGSEYAVKTVDGGTYFEGRGTALAFMGNGYMAITTPKLAREAVTAWKGKGKSALETKGDLMRAAQNAKTRSHVWVAFVMPDMLAQVLKQQAEPVSHVIWASADASLARGLEMSTTGFMTSKDQAKGLVALLEQAKKEAVKDREVQEAGMTKVMESIDITARGTEVQLRVKISAYQVGKMAERLFDELAKSK